MIKDLELEEGLEILSKNYLGHLGYISGKSPFVTPITYFHDAEEKSILSYSANGHKIDAMRQNKFVSLQVEQVQSIQDWSSVQVQESRPSRRQQRTRRCTQTLTRCGFEILP